jgi:hypothetical protein
MSQLFIKARDLIYIKLHSMSYSKTNIHFPARAAVKIYQISLIRELAETVLHQETKRVLLD